MSDQQILPIPNDTDLELFKHSATIHISNNLTALQRKTWNVLVAFAYSELETQQIHQIPINTFFAFLGYNGKNTTYIKKVLSALVTTKIEWNILGKDKSDNWKDDEWSITTLLASGTIRRGILYYEFSTALKYRIYNPRIYAKLSMVMQRKVKGKRSIVFWELGTDYLREDDGVGETPWITVEQMRKLLGVSDDRYQDFKVFRRDCLVNPIKEVNKNTDITLQLKDKRDPFDGRIVTAFKLVIERNKKVSRIPPANKLPISEHGIMDEAEFKELDEKLQSIGVHGTMRIRILQEHPAKTIRNCFMDFEFMMLTRGQSIKNHAGFFIKLLPEIGKEYEFSKDYLNHKRKKKMEEQARIEERRRDQESEEKRRNKILLAKLNEKIDEFFKSIPEEEQKEIETLAQKNVESAGGFRSGTGYDVLVEKRKIIKQRYGDMIEKKK